jgi:hypothetical protein
MVGTADDPPSGLAAPSGRQTRKRLGSERGGRRGHRALFRMLAEERSAENRSGLRSAGCFANVSCVTGFALHDYLLSGLI